MNYLTYKNPGSLGIADVINRIDLLSRLADKYGLIFVVPDMSSIIHNYNYLNEFGFVNYKFHQNDLKFDRSLDIDLTVFLDEFDFNAFDHCIFVVKSFDYNIGGALSRVVIKNDAFPFKKLYDFKGELNNNIDYTIHLRMGDRYVYNFDGVYLCPWKNIYSKDSSELISEYGRQWNFEKLERIVDYFESSNLKYQIFSDGIGSAIRTLKTFSSWKEQKEVDIDILITRLNEFEERFLYEFNNKNLNYAGDRVSDLLDSILNSKNIILTEGGLASTFNKFYNSGKSKETNFNEFYTGINNYQKLKNINLSGIKG